MSRSWFAQELETVAMFWRVQRRDGFAFGLTTHDRDLWFDGMLYRASPGMVASAIRRSASLEPDAAEVEGALAHDSIAAVDLAEGRFDGALVRIGLVDWVSLERTVLYSGTIGEVIDENGCFSAELVSRKAELFVDPVPRTSPSCRAAFCAPGCDLNPARFTREVRIDDISFEENAVAIASIDQADHIGGRLRWLDGPLLGRSTRIVAVSEADKLVLADPLHPGIVAGTRVQLREGCDHTIATCGDRFGNAANFRGEPFLPGNDLLTRYPSPPT